MNSNDRNVRVVTGDITRFSGDAIVNAANSSLLGGGGVDGAIHRAAGPELLSECAKLGGCHTGQSKITNAYRLPCKKVIHTVGPVWRGGLQGEEELLASCYTTVMQLALDNGLHTLAFPCISTGAYRFPKEKAARIALQTIYSFIKEHPQALQVTIICFSADDEDMYWECLNNCFQKERESVLPAGTLLQGGKYKILSLLGQGGFGITYLGIQVGLGRKVAVKEFFMKENCSRDEKTSKVSIRSKSSRENVESYRAKFVKEAQMMAALDNPGIVCLYDIFEENDTAYYVMEYIGGGSLEDYIVANGKCSELESLYYVREVAVTLDYVHQRHINHLDIKPGNILRREDTHLVLIDFGLAKHYDKEGRQTTTTPVGISHGYAPLEQYKQGGVATFSPSSDIYSLGGVLYKLLTGKTPPHAEVLFNEGLSTVPSGVSSNVWNVVEAAMQPRSKDRPQSVEEFLDLLDGKKTQEVGKRGNETNNRRNTDRELVNGFPVRWNVEDYVGDERRILVQDMFRFLLGNMHSDIFVSTPLVELRKKQSTVFIPGFYMSDEPLEREQGNILLDNTFEISDCSYIPVPGDYSALEIVKLLRLFQKITRLPFRLFAPYEYEQQKLPKYYNATLLYNSDEVCFYETTEYGLSLIRNERLWDNTSRYVLWLVLDVEACLSSLLNDYDEIGMWHYGFAPVRIKDKWGMMNRFGYLVIPLTCDSITEVSPFTRVPGPGKPASFLGCSYTKGNKKGCFKVIPDYQMQHYKELTEREWNEREMFT